MHGSRAAGTFCTAADVENVAKRLQEDYEQLCSKLDKVEYRQKVPALPQVDLIPPVQNPTPFSLSATCCIILHTMHTHYTKVKTCFLTTPHEEMKRERRE